MAQTAAAEGWLRLQGHTRCSTCINRVRGAEVERELGGGLAATCVGQLEWGAREGALAGGARATARPCRRRRPYWAAGKRAAEGEGRRPPRSPSVEGAPGPPSL